MVRWLSFKKPIIVLLYFSSLLPLLSFQNAIYLFNTEDNDAVEYYDCLILDTVPYCRRPGSPINLHRDNETVECHYNGTRRTFEELRLQNKTSNEIIHEFRSSIEKAEEYALYLAGQLNSSSLCECPKRSFGKNCEYQIISGASHTTFSESRKWQNDQRKSKQFQIHAYQKTLCYATLICDCGLLCLDWRDICDGRQQCMNGTDEEACDLLEFNECEEDEYRCSNGMCIPDIYFLDGEYDCMDYSDERQPFDHSICALQANPFNCDEHICSVTEWSCGDGQCIDEINRYQWQEYAVSTKAQCFSMREYMFLCELSVRYKLWTYVGGTCYSSSVIDPIDEEWNRHNRTADEYCQYLVKCALSNGLERNCPCKRQTCNELITKNCPSSIPCPSKGLLTPYLVAYYDTTRKWSENKQPDFYMMSGDIRCRGHHAQIPVNRSVRLRDETDKRHIALANLFCEHEDIWKSTSGSLFHSSCYANFSHPLGNKSLPYAFVDVCKRCISQYRINDGTQDCLMGEDERPQEKNTCTKSVRRHRFRCSLEQDTCLMVKALGDSVPHCAQGNDEFVSGTGQSLSTTLCVQVENDDCRFLTEYILTSKSDFNNSRQMTTKAQMLFRFYCNTFWNLADKSDESFETCQNWICARDEYQCSNGQCIPRDYVCDDEWDCADASDELFHLEQLNSHNQLIKLTQKQNACAINKSAKAQPFDHLCNVSSEYYCLLVNFTRQTDIFHTRPCIKNSQIGDNVIDCLGGLDERNTQTHCRGVGPLGFAFQCQSTPNMCIEADNLCSGTGRCSDSNDDMSLCGNRDKECSHPLDMLCINGTCRQKARCNRKIDCEYGEDEYWCDTDVQSTDSTHYRLSKRFDQLNRKKYFPLSRYPPESNRINTTVIEEQSNRSKRSISGSVPSSIAHLRCNRGVAASYYTNRTVCFCPPSYYGEYCEYHADRVTSYVHVNVSHSSYAQLTTDQNMTIKVLVLLMHKNQIIHSRQFHIRSAVDFHRRVKKGQHLIYSRAEKLLDEKKHRRSNRSSIIDQNLYYLRYEAYELKTNHSIRIAAVWQYPLFFDFLPSFRLAKILRFHEKRSESSSPCQSHPCNSSNTECHVLQNDPTRYVCLCKSGYSGEQCSIRDQHCANNFCHFDSWCKPNYMGSMAGSRLPFCLCPLNVYGTRCGLVYDQCWNNPCKNNGSCYPSTSNLTKVNCICTKAHYGSFCEIPKESVDLTVHQSNVSGISVIQYFYIDMNTLNLILEHQDVFQQHPNHLHYQYAKTIPPAIVLLKSYSTGNSRYPKIFLLSLPVGKKKVNSSTNLTDKNLCVNLEDIPLTIPVHQYHMICRNSSISFVPLCFFDAQYLCFCETDNYRAECFVYDHKLDQCNECYSKGRCIRGDLQEENDFICLCPTCYSGSRCQFSTEQFSFTIEQLFEHGLLSAKTSIRQLTLYAMIIAACMFFVIGALNNLCTFVTFYRSKFLRTGVGNYILVGSVINQLTLFFLSIRLIHVVLNVTGRIGSLNIVTSKLFCKSVVYVLTSSSQLSYWLMSTVAIERLYVTWNIKGMWLKKPCVARRIMLILTIVILFINTPQILFYTSLPKAETNGTTCVLIFSSSYWTRLNQVNNYVNSLLPLTINIICTGGIMLLITRQKLSANRRSIDFLILITAFRSGIPMVLPNIRTAFRTNENEAITETRSITPSFSNIDGINQNLPHLVPSKSRWHFFRTVVHENMDLIFGPAITIVPQLFSLPQLILSSAMSCHDFGKPSVRYSLIVSFFVLFTPQLTSFLLYVRSSSVYYAHFRSTSIGKKMVWLGNCYRQSNKNQCTYSTPSRYALSNTAKIENSTIIEKTHQ